MTNVFLDYALLFMAGGMIGWGIEVFYRHFNAHRKYWINPGFLTGPYLPLYGFGLCTLYTLTQIENLLPIGNAVWRRIALFFIMMAAMTLVEFIAGSIFIRGMHIALWDYSDNRFNYQGIICPLYSFFWGLLGAGYYFLVHPAVGRVLAWLAAHPAFSFVIGFCYGIFFIDCVMSFRVVARIKALAEEYKVRVSYEELKGMIAERAAAGWYRIRFFLTMHTPELLSDVMRAYAVRRGAKASPRRPRRRTRAHGASAKK